MLVSLAHMGGKTRCTAGVDFLALLFVGGCADPAKQILYRCLITPRECMVTVALQCFVTGNSAMMVLWLMQSRTATK